MPASTAKHTVVRVPGALYDELYVRAELAAGSGAAAVEALLRAVEDEHGAAVVRATVSGPLGSRVRDARVVTIGPGSGSGVAVEIVAVAPGPEIAVTRVDAGTTLLETVDGASVRRLVHVVPEPAGPGPQAQLRSIFDGVEDVLGASGMSPSHLVRTWYFLRDIGTTYRHLNDARDEAFDRWGLRHLPASTGIGAELPHPATWCAAVVEAIAHDGAPVATPFETDLQRPPVQYGPRFARANLVEHNGLRTVNVSGISAIDEAGRSVRVADRDDAVVRALDGFEDLLQRAGMTPTDLCSVSAYSVDERVREAFVRIAGRRGWTVSVLHNTAAVCRPDLVFEVEGRAVRRAP
ncbi:hypothetical protein [Cellulosimicrobium protaetiae]|uniref:Enamine deaminase RidA, house cleaning of reactive enamine intermediates, YjgF/YER057c/UK114 family n=1 Tax=Cellulosimicrobium protaetiae TaxID=2587808 RepID=A0A6M5UDR7_9MICO|nr:hypothetical protein [Cellulosimicrobium protaetiae]QJW34849.1 hypothetical protein FIC82_000165 [Cellulosimicrobium protaetiae]